MSEIIIGIDPGSLKTGFGVIECIGNKNIHITHGTILLDKNKPVSSRLKDLSIDLATVIDKYRPTGAAVEDVFIYKNPRSALILGQARGVALATLGLRGLEVASIPPTAVKSLVTGRGRANKFQVAEIIALELMIDVPKSKDASDALAIALAASYLTRNCSSMSKSL